MTHLKKYKIENLLVIQENEFPITKSMHPLKMQLLYTHANKIVRSDVQICFPAQYLNKFACYILPHAEHDPGPKLAPVSPTPRS